MTKMNKNGVLWDYSGLSMTKMNKNHKNGVLWDYSGGCL